MRSVFFIGFVWLVFFIHSSRISNAQVATNRNFKTQATDPKARPDARKMGPKTKIPLYLIRENTKGTLYGNPCFEEVSAKFGFKYLVVPGKIPPNRNAFRRNMHNFGVNTVLFFRNGPFWKTRMNKKFRDCKYGYGDFTG